MAKHKQVSSPEPEPGPRPDWPHTIKCHLCSASLDKDSPDVRWAKRHCPRGCAWYLCICGGRKRGAHMELVGVGTSMPVPLMECPGPQRGGDCGALVPISADFCPRCERTFSGGELHRLLVEEENGDRDFTTIPKT